MSKTNGHRRLPTPLELDEIIQQGRKLMRSLPRDWNAQKTGDDLSRYQRFEVASAEPWRNTNGKKELKDICRIKGGLSPRAGAIAEWIAWSRNVLPILFSVITRYKRLVPDERYEPEMGAYFPDAASDRLVGFLELVAEAFEVLGFKENNLGHHPGDRLIGSDRKEKAELLRRLADFIDPVNDEARLRKLHHQQRVAANGLPTNEDIRKMFTNEDLRNVLPESLRTVLDDEEYFDKELERAELDATAQRRWELPSRAIRLYVRSRLANFDTWGHFRNYRVPNPTPDKSLEGLDGEERWEAEAHNMMRPHNDILEYYKKDMAEMVYDLANDPDWLRKNRDTEDAIFNKIMSGESTGVDAYWDMEFAVSNWDFPERPTT